ncbi:MAG: hypothetical protein ACE5J7_03205 [Candidatus Aenigmatarchaeota archaeon]
MAGKQGESYKKPLSDIKKDLGKKLKSESYIRSIVKAIGSDPAYRKDLERMMQYREQAKGALKRGNRKQANSYMNSYTNRMMSVEQKAIINLTRAAGLKALEKKLAEKKALKKKKAS